MTTMTTTFSPLTFTVGKRDLSDFQQGEQSCYLLANGLGGFSSLTAVNSAARHDHALFMCAKVSPNHRMHFVTNIEETLQTNGINHPLSSQQYVKRTANQFGGMYLHQFEFCHFPKWSYQVGGMEIIKEVVMVYGHNTVAVRYQIYNHALEQATLTLKPLFRLTDKDTMPTSAEEFTYTTRTVTNHTSQATCYVETNGITTTTSPTFYTDLFFEYDARDGRDCVGTAFVPLTITCDIHQAFQEYVVLFADKNFTGKNLLDSITPQMVQSLFQAEYQRQCDLLLQSNVTCPLAQTLTLAADKFITYRASTRQQTIIAGYPWFGDWGRDTMIALLGCALSTNRIGDAKSMLRTFQRYEKEGLLPNVFPESEMDDPRYNTVDASLLFINAIYETYQRDKDVDFVAEMFDTIGHIIACYRAGTAYHIYMDTDGLICAGAKQEQLTWMDVRYGDILPTPRHGKPVEIQGYWYNALRIADVFAKLLQKDRMDYYTLAEEVVKPHFLASFWNPESGCFKDVLSSTAADIQIRPNQIWTLSMPFSMVGPDMAKQVLGVITKELYTPYGLRSLAMNDPQYIGEYGGSHFHRDMAYHQGTVWTFPLGAYYLALHKYGDNAMQATLQRQLNYTTQALLEGCLGQLAEIYDGSNPHQSQGCFAQAWSVGELLRVLEILEIT